MAERLTDDEITARAIEQALRELPEPSREQAHDAVCAAIAGWATCNWDRLGDGGIDDMDILTDIRRLEHATRLLRAEEQAREVLIDARKRFDVAPGVDWMLLVDAIDKVLDRDSSTGAH